LARYVDYKNITKVIQPGRIIYVDDGVLAFDVLEIVDEQTIKVRARNNGFISSRKGVNLPNTDVDLPALSEKDKNDLRFGVKNGVDMIFACKLILRDYPVQRASLWLTPVSQPLSGGGRTSRTSVKFLVRRVAASRSLPRLRTARASITSPRFSPRPTV
jgi:hypothetical protein